MHPLPYLADRQPFADADRLIAGFGERAVEEASARADRSRDLGNHIRFCHWRQVARLIGAMSVQQAFGTVH